MDDLPDWLRPAPFVRPASAHELGGHLPDAGAAARFRSHIASEIEGLPDKRLRSVEATVTDPVLLEYEGLADG